MGALKMRQRVILPRPESGDASMNVVPFAAATGFALGGKYASYFHQQKITVAATVSLAAANDYGGSKIADLGATDLYILGVEANLAITIAGMTTAVIDSNLTGGIGTATASNATLATTMINLGTLTCAGAATTGTARCGFVLAIATNPVNGGSIFLNFAQPVTSGTGTVVCTGTINVFYMNLGVHS